MKLKVKIIIRLDIENLNISLNREYITINIINI